MVSPPQTSQRTACFLARTGGSYDVTDDIQLSENEYFRQNRIKTFNGDDSDFDECENNPSLVCDQEGEVAEDINGNAIAAGDNVEGATNNTSATFMRGRGGSVQAAFNRLFGHENRLWVIRGRNYDYANVHFASDTELAELAKETRGTIGSKIFTRENKVRLNTSTKTFGIYFSEFLDITDKLTATVASRYNHVAIQIRKPIYR